MYDGNSYEVYKIEKNLDPLPTMKYEGCTYQIYPDNTLALYCFDDNTISSVDIPDSIDDMKVTGIKMFAFDESEITSVHLSETISYIEPFAFYKCEELYDINLPKNLKSIGGSGFYECILGDLNIDCPNLLFSKFSFYNCLARNVVINTRVVPEYIMTFFNRYKSITLGNDVKEIGISLLEEDIEIPENVKVITFRYVLGSIKVPASIEILGAYGPASGNLYHSVSIGGDPKIPLIENENIFKFSSNGTINGYYGTEAHSYALAHNLKFNPLDDVTYGDSNGDNVVSVADMVSLSQYLLNNAEITWGADLTKDGKIDSFDMIPMRKMILNNK